MGFPMFSSQATPIAIDFGSSSLKLLQIGAGTPPPVMAAAAIPIPEHIRLDADGLFGFYEEALPLTLSKGKFKGKKAILAIPSVRTLVQHTQLAPVDQGRRDDLLKTQLYTELGCPPDRIVVRWTEVGEVHRDGEMKTELICFAVTRDTVMRYVDLLKRCKLEAVGVHTEILALVRSYDHLNRRDSDKNVTTMYVDLGWGGTRVAIAHGRKIAFARSIQLGGRQLDEAFANAMHCDVATARAHRLALDEPVKKRERAVAAAEAPVGAMLNAAARAQAAETPESAEAAVATQPERRVGARPPEYCFDVEPDTASGSPALDLAEVLDTITDELSMCLRYHQGLFSGRSINRVVFLGGEARQIWLCKHLVKCLRISGQLGDPLARFVVPSNIKTPGLGLGEPQPGWAVACGLSTAPPDL